jgi:lipopolysaccharide biosynthesis glycosyltransferase
MKTAIVVFAYGEYLRGAKLLFHTLRRYGLPGHVKTILLTPEPMAISFAENVAARDSGISVPSTVPEFSLCAKKLSVLSLDFDRIIGLDADVFCSGDCSLLWSNSLNALPFYAARDYGAIENYPIALKESGLNPDLIFNSGVYVYNRWIFPNLYDNLVYSIKSDVISSYDRADQGWLNGYFQVNDYGVGFLPPEYNYCLASTFPQLPEDKVRLAHFVGPREKPWEFISPPNNLYHHWNARWRKEWSEYVAQI